jgi:hypothetical protein
VISTVADVSWRREDAATEVKQKSVLQSVLGVAHSLGQTYFKRRYTILFCALVFMIVASPLIAAFGLSGAVIESLLAASLLVAVMPIHAGRIRNLMLGVMTAVWLARPVTAWLGHPTLSEMTLAAWTLIGLLAAAAALRFAMRGAKVDAEHLFAALSALPCGVRYRHTQLLPASRS